jgi:hypothetical protein
VTDWPSYNRSLVRRGEILFSYDFLDEWDIVLAKMNEKIRKEGNSFILIHLFLLLVTYDYTFIYHIDKLRE